MQANKGPSAQSLLPVAWVLLTVALVLAVHWRTSRSIVDQWQQSQTYSHGFIVIPIFIWLVWTQRDALARLAIRPFWPAAPILFLLGVLWLVGEAAAASALSQFAVVAMVPASIATLLGVRWLHALAFPMFFLLFAIPVGDALVPTLMDWTADFTVAALKLSGIPVYRDGTRFSTPSGDWSIVESCSGIRYVFACLTVSTLYAWVMYRSSTRRALFVVAALCIAIVANWLRAYSIVMLAHLTDNRVAVGVDHLIDVGGFLGVILVVTMLVGALWREDTAMGSTQPMPREKTTPSEGAATVFRERPRLAATLVVVTLVCVWPLAIRGLHAKPTQQPPQMRHIVPIDGWAPVSRPMAGWQPQLRNPVQVATQTFEKAGQRVTVQVAVFGRPTPESKLVTSSNRLIPPDDAHWSLVQRGTVEVQHQGEAVRLATSTLVGPEGRLAVWHWYWVDGARTSSPVAAAARQLVARLAQRSENAAWITLVATDDAQTPGAETALRSFAAEMLSAVESPLRSPVEAPRP